MAFKTRCSPSTQVFLLAIWLELHVRRNTANRAQGPGPGARGPGEMKVPSGLVCDGTLLFAGRAPRAQPGAIACGSASWLHCPGKYIFLTNNIQTPQQDGWITEPKNQETGKRTMDYDGLMPHFKYNEHLIHLMSFSNGRHIGGGAFEFTNTQLLPC